MVYSLRVVRVSIVTQLLLHAVTLMQRQRRSSGPLNFQQDACLQVLRLCFVVSNTGCELITTAQCGLETVEGGILDSDGFS